MCGCGILAFLSIFLTVVFVIRSKRTWETIKAVSTEQAALLLCVGLLFGAATPLRTGND